MNGFEFFGRGGLAILPLASAVLMGGCAGMQTAATPARELPAFVYPDEPPLVNRTTLGKLVQQLNSRRIVLWVFSDLGERSAATAAALAAQHPALRAEGVRVVALYAGPGSNWRTAVAPLLRNSGASFPGAVAAPDALPAIAAWLLREPKSLPEGVFILDRSGRLLASGNPEPGGLAAELARLLKVEPSGGDYGTSHAQLRLILLSTGQVVGNFSAEAADTAALAAMLVPQVLAARRENGTVAVLPFRVVGSSKTAAEAGNLLANHVAEGLSRRGWQAVVRPQQTSGVLEAMSLTPLEVEFDVGRLAARVPWVYLLAGSVQTGK